MTFLLENLNTDHGINEYYITTPVGETEMHTKFEFKNLETKV